MLTDPHPSQQHPDLHHAVGQLQQEVTRPRARFKPTSPENFSSYFDSVLFIPTHNWFLGWPIPRLRSYCSFKHSNFTFCIFFCIPDDSFLNGPFPANFSFIFVFFKHYNFYSKIYVKNVHQVYGTGD